MSPQAQLPAHAKGDSVPRLQRRAGPNLAQTLNINTQGSALSNEERGVPAHYAV